MCFPKIGFLFLSRLFLTIFGLQIRKIADTELPGSLSYIGCCCVIKIKIKEQ
jgi:hypothetical protein